MKIILIADPEIPVPPMLYGGIERIIAMLVEVYVNEGHQVALIAHHDSSTPARLIPYPVQGNNSIINTLKNASFINRELFKNEFDIIHSFARLLYLIPQLPRRIPKIMSYQREPTISQIKRAAFLAKKNTLAFTGCSAYISKQIAPHAPSYPIFNGVDLTKFQFSEQVAHDASLVFLGRIEPIKGTHIAIEVAQRANRRLIIAGNIPAEYQTYFEEQVKPQLDERITYIGPVNDVQKNDLLGDAAAFLMPILWNEPFGIVMAEAMACGTPVIGFNRGSVPEVVLNGINGYSCTTTDEMVALVAKVNQLDRRKVRTDAELRFSERVIAGKYLDLYDQLIKKSFES